MTSTIARPRHPGNEEPEGGSPSARSEGASGDLAERFLHQLTGGSGGGGLDTEVLGSLSPEERAAAIGRAAIAAYRGAEPVVGAAPTPTWVADRQVAPQPRPIPELAATVPEVATVADNAAPPFSDLPAYDTVVVPAVAPVAVPSVPSVPAVPAVPSPSALPSPLPSAPLSTPSPPRSRRLHAAKGSSTGLGSYLPASVRLPSLRLPSVTLPSSLRLPGLRTEELSDHHRRRLVSVSNWVRNIGVLLILFAAWQLWGTAISQHHTQESLAQQFQGKVHTAHTTPGFQLAPVSERIPDPPSGSVEALIQIPKIGMNQYVVSGTDTDDLAKGPGHYVGTAAPGQAGNVAIAGHRTTHGAPFNRLAELSVGDPIYLTTLSGQRLTYIVAEPPYPVSPSDVSVLNYFGDNRLTLTTCNPEFSAVQRLIVVAEYEPPGTKNAHPVVNHGAGRPVNVQAAGEAGWNVGEFPLILLEVGLLVVLGLFNGRLAKRFGRESRWLILIPIWLALIFALFQTLTTFLPAAA